MRIKEYITGLYALNIHHLSDPDEPTGDWHGSIWDGIRELPNKNVRYAGEGHEINTFEVWGDWGIFNDKKSFEEMGIKVSIDAAWMANYYRAILDLLFDRFIRLEDALGLYCCTEDHFDTEQQKLLIIEKLRLASPWFTKKARLNMEKFIEHEINYEKLREALK
jgi:hypothetical protein